MYDLKEEMPKKQRRKKENAGLGKPKAARPLQRDVLKALVYRRSLEAYLPFDPTGNGEQSTRATRKKKAKRKTKKQIKEQRATAASKRGT